MGHKHVEMLYLNDEKHGASTSDFCSQMVVSEGYLRCSIILGLSYKNVSRTERPQNYFET